MKKLGLFVLIFSLVVMITACDSEPLPPPTATDAPEPAATTAPEPTATDVPEPTATDAPEPTEEADADEAVDEEPVEEVVEEAPAEESEEASDGESEDVQVIDVTMHVTGYTPAEVTVKPGSHVRFNMTNTDSEEHDLYNRQAKIDVALQPGEDVAYEWVAPDKPGTYVAECSFHEGLIMTVIVEE